MASVYAVGMERETAQRGLAAWIARSVREEWAASFNEYMAPWPSSSQPSGRRPKLAVEQKEACAVSRWEARHPDQEKPGGGSEAIECDSSVCPWGAQVGVDLSTSGDWFRPSSRGWLIANISAPPAHPRTGCAGDCGILKKTSLWSQRLENIQLDTGKRRSRGLGFRIERRVDRRRSGLPVGPKKKRLRATPSQRISVTKMIIF